MERVLQVDNIKLANTQPATRSIMHTKCGQIVDPTLNQIRTYESWLLQHISSASVGVDNMENTF
jgi:hypothetical protein